MFNSVVEYIRELYGTSDFIPLHEPRFTGNEKKYVVDCIDSTYVSSVGKYVDRFEEMVAEYSGSKHAIACVNGTTALQIALQLAGVKSGEEVITQPLSFVATANAIIHANANPVFVDVDKDTLGLSPDRLNDFLRRNASITPDKKCINLKTGKRIAACVPMHTFGHPCKIDEIKIICDKHHITLVEDAAESLGSYYKEKHTGTFGLFGTLSFNGNKTITTGGGGMIITDNEELARKAKHITTTAKLPHKWAYVHDMIAYNYRLPNINAALGCAQMENLSMFIEKKRKQALKYQKYFEQTDIRFIAEPKNSKSNYWLNAIILNNKEDRDTFLHCTNKNGIMTRPAWQLMNRLTMYRNCQCGDLTNAEWLADKVVNIPSSVIS